MISESGFGGSMAPRTASEVLCSNLSQGIHAAAQPLTILRVSLCKANTDRMGIRELQELASSSAREVERVCALFSCLQQFVATENIVPVLSSFPISPLIAHVSDGFNLLFQEDGMFFRATVQDGCPSVLIDRSRTLQALSGVILVAHSVSHGTDTIGLVASSSFNGVQIVVQNLSSSVGAMNAEQKLSMALAQASIRSQHGDLNWTGQPFSVQIDLPQAPLAA